MGFYGKIYEQAVNIFRCLKFKNNNSENFPTTSLADTIALQANGGEACATLNAGNRWIQFVGNNDDNLNCKIYHAKSSQDAGKKEIFTSTPHEGVDFSVTGINFGAIITVQYPIIDAAGHIIGYEEKKYQLQSDISALQNTLNEHAILLESLDTSIKTAIESLSGADTALDKKIDDSIGSIQKSASDAEIAAERANTSAGNAWDAANEAKASAEAAATDAGQAVTKVGELEGDITVLNAQVKLILKHLELE